MAGMMFMMTELFEITENYVPWSSKLVGSKDKAIIVDSRLRLIITEKNFQNSDIKKLYRNYLATFAELTNRSQNSMPASYAACGFVPIGVEPECLCNRINKAVILPALKELGVEYFLLHPSSPVSSSYKPIMDMASNHDIWVNKIDLGNIIQKPIYNITSIDLLEVIYHDFT